MKNYNDKLLENIISHLDNTFHSKFISYHNRCSTPPFEKIILELIIEKLFYINDENNFSNTQILLNVLLKFNVVNVSSNVLIGIAKHFSDLFDTLASKIVCESLDKGFKELIKDDGSEVYLKIALLYADYILGRKFSLSINLENFEKIINSLSNHIDDLLKIIFNLRNQSISLSVSLMNIIYLQFYLFNLNISILEYWKSFFHFHN